MKGSEMKSVVVIYSPLCEQNGTFLSQLEEWLKSTGFNLCEVPFDEITEREKEWYESCGLLRNGRFKRSVFIDVFFEGKLIDSVPLKRENMEKELGIDIRDTEGFTSSGKITVPAASQASRNVQNVSSQGGYPCPVINLHEFEQTSGTSQLVSGSPSGSIIHSNDSIASSTVC